MKLLLLIAVLFAISGCSSKMKNSEVSLEYKTSFNEVWNQIRSEPLEKFPQNEVSFFKLFSDDGDKISKDAQRTMDERSDILKPFEKLAHPNGICFKGIWEIEAETKYSGYFKQGSKALIIARASTAMSNTKSGSTRAFGFAGKLFPTMNPNEQNTEPSANFFLIDDLGGTDASHYTDVVLSNEPSVSFTYEVFTHLFYALKVSSAFSNVDKHPGIRQVYEVSSLGEKSPVITPKWMKIEAKERKKVDAKDFREELSIKEGETLVFNVSVANEMVDEKKLWQKIGTIRLDSSVVSNACDHRLHFHHAKWRDDL